MRYLTVGLLLATTLVAAPMMAAEEPISSGSDINLVAETIIDLLDWLEDLANRLEIEQSAESDSTSEEIGPAIEPNGEPESTQEGIGGAIEPNG